jgi:hypothetical protein
LYTLNPAGHPARGPQPLEEAPTMVDTITTRTETPGLDALVEMVADAEAAGDALLSTNRVIDALLDARSETSGEATAALDAALGACTHRQVLPVAEAVELVAEVTSRV